MLTEPTLQNSLPIVQYMIRKGMPYILEGKGLAAEVHGDQGGDEFDEEHL